MDADGFRPPNLPSPSDLKTTTDMSKDSKTAPPPLATPPIRYGEASDALSLHSTSAPPPSDRFFDDDPPELRADDLPPLYTDVSGGGGGDDDDTVSAAAPLLPLGPRPAPDAPRCHHKNAPDGDEYYLDGRLDSDPEFLQRQVERWAACPPRPFVQVRGTHTEKTTRRSGKDNKTETRTVTDFDVWVDLTPFLYRDINRGEAWAELRTVENDEKARRGGVFRSRAPGRRGGIQLEQGVADGKPSLLEWCHRYCASHAALKSFMLRRAVVGFDEVYVRRQIETLVRSTQYRGTLEVTFPVRDEHVYVYNDRVVNRWRLTVWVCWVFYLTLLFLIAWPCLFFSTRKFEVAVAEWHFSRPKKRATQAALVSGSGSGSGSGLVPVLSMEEREFVSVSEAQFYNMWARAIQRAVLDKRQGTLDQSDLRAAEALGPSFGGLGEGAAAELLRAGINAMGVVNRQFGWGEDSG